MRNLKKTLSVFAETIKILNGDNLVLGGSNALELHGLEIGREANDVDLIIYRPTTEQTAFLDMSRQISGQKTKLDPDDYPVRVTKFIKTLDKKYSLDVIVSSEEMPRDLLSYDFLEGRLKIQSIHNIVKAKSGYLHKVDNRGSCWYISEKDSKDLQQLKNLNFNL
jgi:hypothetical protein